MGSKQLVYDTLEFKNKGRAPRHLWVLPWAEHNFPKELAEIRANYPDDIISCPKFLREEIVLEHGDPYEIGEYTDEWGCTFTNLHRGIIGEVKMPLVKDDEWTGGSSIRFPLETLNIDTEKVNRFCVENKDKFILSGGCPRPFERLQFIRGTENLFIDLLVRPEKFLDFIKKLHEFYCEELLAWAKTDVDGLTFMDDWGAQHSLLINPKLWQEIFKPFYKDYIDIAHSHGKKAFMHSDGYIVDIYPHLVELGLDALNSQVFCMEPETLAAWKGKITFWGEMDRQHLLPNGTYKDIENAVHRLKDNLWQQGGCVAQCEFGPGAKAENIVAMMQTWQEITGD